MADSPENLSTERDPDMPDDALGLGLEPAAPEAPQQTAAGAYRVLARKYRPQTFSALIGQDAMVRTLGNAIKRDRLAHAFLMTGVRGVGKTSTARLIAKALNCVGPNGDGGPTIDPCGKCDPCQAIAEGRHIDVIEMDAASNTGVDDVREIIEAVRYAAVSARYKIYIIDEVHMLSRNAFNALLKTLEEPPEHVKFIFATTEVNKVPITVLSRCQRFDLKRIPVATLEAHFAAICLAEKVEADGEALALVAQAAEGSVRDGLSILDQAIAHADMEGDGKVTAAQLRTMLGLSDRAAIRRLLGLVLDGDPQAMLEELTQQHMLGVEPSSVMAGLLGEVHRLSLAKIGTAGDADLPQDAREEVERLADRIGSGALHRLWQMLLKGNEEVQRAPSPREACEMALLRVIYAASLPDPGDLARLLSGQSTTQTGAANNGGNSASSQVKSSLNSGAEESENKEISSSGESVLPTDFGALLDLLGERGFIRLEMALRDTMRVVDYAPPRLAFQWSAAPPAGMMRELQDALSQSTGAHWQLEESEGDAAPSLLEQEKAAAEAEMAAVMDSPIVKAAFAAFPDAELIETEATQPDRRSA